MLRPIAVVDMPVDMPELAAQSPRWCWEKDVRWIVQLLCYVDSWLSLETIGSRY
jgi:hypothetical protein